MNIRKLALIVWSIFPKKIGQSFYVNGSCHEFELIWFGKEFRVRTSKLKG